MPDFLVAVSEEWSKRRNALLLAEPPLPEAGEGVPVVLNAADLYQWGNVWAGLTPPEYFTRAIMHP